MIISKEDSLKLKNLELGETLTSVIPILERENLETVMSVKQGKAVYGMGNMEFFIHFDDRILNKNYLKEITDEIDVRMNKNLETIAHAQEALKNTELSILKIENFP